MSLKAIFDSIFFEPILKVLLFIQDTIPGHSFGWAIILLTVMIRLLLWPLAAQSIRSQKAMQELQPELNALKDKYKNQKEKQAQAMMELYKNKNINPLSGCLPILIQFPILIALYYALQKGLQESDSNMFFGLDLSQRSPILALITGVLQYYQVKMMVLSKSSQPQKNQTGQGDLAQIMNKQMLYFMPLMLAFTAYYLPAGLALYLVITTAFSVVQQYYTMKKA